MVNCAGGADPNLSAFLDAGYSCPVWLWSQKKIYFPKLATRRVCTLSMSAVCSEARMATGGVLVSGIHSGSVCAE